MEPMCFGSFSTGRGLAAWVRGGVEVDMRLEEGVVYSMPLIMGPLFKEAQRPGRVYGEVESLSATFRTEREALRPLVPSCFLIPEEPTATVSFSVNNHVDFMAGGGYRIGYVGVSARFEGEEDVDGLHILVMWENDTLPIFTGREMIGIPKLHADITQIRQVDEGLRASASVWGHEVLGLDVAGLKEQNMVVRRTAQKRINSIPWLGYKHIPAIDGPADVSYPMVVWNEIELDELWFGDTATPLLPTVGHADLDRLAVITETLARIPLGELEFAAHAKGSAVLRIDRSHRLT